MAKSTLTQPERNVAITALDTLVASLKRAANTEKSPEVKAIREKQHAEATALRNKIATTEIEL